jgi:parallel beta-helix repeat protein
MRHLVIRSILAIFSLSTLYFTLSADAATVYVTPKGDDANPGTSWSLPKKTVTAALIAASSDDQIWVAAGTYNERITLKAGVALYGGFAGTETELAQRNFIANLTILDGQQGGSVVTSPSGVTVNTRIDGFTIQNGTGTLSLGFYRYGGGIFCSSSSPTITNNIISGNVGYSAIYCNSSSPMISNNMITGNGNSFNGYGGGIYCESSSSPMIINNTISGNYNSTNSSGIGIYCKSSSPTIINNIITYNVNEIYNDQGGMPVLQNNCVYNPTGNNYLGLSAGTGDINLDPLFVDRLGNDFHLTNSSPCIDHGINSGVQTEWLDMDGQDRINGSHVDMGADEYYPAPTIVYVATIGSDANTGASWPQAKRTVQAGIDIAAVSGSEVWVSEGTYNERIRLKLGVVLYGGFAGNEIDLSQRNFRSHATILDGQQGGSVVIVVPNANSTTQIDGFTIQNGSSYGNNLNYGGGGIFCKSSSPTISNNTIMRNNSSNGGGIYCCYSSSPMITNNTISGNNASLYGGGIYCDIFSSPTLINNNINGNRVTGDGGGIYCKNHSSPVVSNNTILGNNASNGGGICCSYGSSPKVRNNMINGNNASKGGGIYCYQSSPNIRNNTISGNIASEGGGIFCSDESSPPNISNNIIAFNSNGIYFIYSNLYMPLILNNCVFNPIYNYSGSWSWTGDVYQDPLFVDRAGGDFHLSSGSPCINKGNDADVQVGCLDMDGQARINGSHVDMGADEWYPPIPGDANSDNKVDVGDLGILAANYGGSGKSWKEGDFNDDGLVDVGDLSILAAHYGEGVVNATINFNADYAQAFGTIMTQEDNSEDVVNETSSSVCSSVGLSLIAGLASIGLLLVKFNV